jgi:predicted component of type VI protein secretion system
MEDLMDISKTSNMYIAIAETRCRAGDDLEDHARDLAVALQAVISEGLGKSDWQTVKAEFKYLLKGGDKSHREASDGN